MKYKYTHCIIESLNVTTEFEQELGIEAVASSGQIEKEKRTRHSACHLTSEDQEKVRRSVNAMCE